MSDDAQALAEISREEHDPEFSGSQPRFPKTPTYKLLNRSPKIDYSELTPEGLPVHKFLPGIRVEEDQIVPRVQAVILWSTDARQLGAETKEGFRTLCESCDGVAPSARVATPKCSEMTAAEVAAVLRTYKGYDEARVKKVTAEVTDARGRLSFCGIKLANGGVVPLCPQARRVKGGPKPLCKPEVFLAAYDVERQRVFHMRLRGQSISTFKFKAPYHEFREFLGGHKPPLPCYAFSLNLSPLKGPSGYFFLNFTDYKPISKAENRAAMKDLAYSQRDFYMKRACQLPTQPGGLAVIDAGGATAPTVEAGALTNTADESGDVSFDSDDIPF